ncbi:MAG: hypothetical protein IPF68_19665 [Bacteroidales bacterium]|nr:hypothetical protein [Bacteroidales bacterium]
METACLLDEFNPVKGLDSVFAIGDIAPLSLRTYQNGHPQVAQVVICRP